MSSNGISAPPETSSASCHAASSTKAASVSWSARLCMPPRFNGAGAAPSARTRACSPAGLLRGDADRLGRLRLLRAGALGAEPRAAVRAHRLDDGDERASLVGQRVLDPGRDLREGLAGDDPLLLQRAQAQREGARGDPLER